MQTLKCGINNECMQKWSNAIFSQHSSRPAYTSAWSGLELTSVRDELMQGFVVPLADRAAPDQTVAMRKLG